MTPRTVPTEECPSYLLHDRDAAFAGVAGTIAVMQIQEVVTAPRSPWQNAYVERVIDQFGTNVLPIIDKRINLN